MARGWKKLPTPDQTVREHKKVRKQLSDVKSYWLKNLIRNGWWKTTTFLTYGQHFWDSVSSWKVLRSLWFVWTGRRRCRGRCRRTSWARAWSASACQSPRWTTSWPRSNAGKTRIDHFEYSINFLPFWTSVNWTGADAINISGLLVLESRLPNPKKLRNFKNWML